MSGWEMKQRSHRDWNGGRKGRGRRWARAVRQMKAMRSGQIQNPPMSLGQQTFLPLIRSAVLNLQAYESSAVIYQLLGARMSHTHFFWQFQLLVKVTLTFSMRGLKRWRSTTTWEAFIECSFPCFPESRDSVCLLQWEEFSPGMHRSEHKPTIAWVRHIPSPPLTLQLFLSNSSAKAFIHLLPCGDMFRDARRLMKNSYSF